MADRRQQLPVQRRYLAAVVGKPCARLMSCQPSAGGTLMNTATVRYDGTVHDFMLLNALCQTQAARAAIGQANMFLSRALGTLADLLDSGDGQVREAREDQRGELEGVRRRGVLRAGNGDDSHARGGGRPHPIA